LLAGAKRLLRLPHLRALQVTDLDREALEPGSGDGDRREQLGVTVAGNDLRGDVLPLEAEPGEDPGLELGARRRVGADRAGDRADGRLGEGTIEALRVAVGLEGEAGE